MHLHQRSHPFLIPEATISPTFLLQQSLPCLHCGGAAHSSERRRPYESDSVLIPDAVEDVEPECVAGVGDENGGGLVFLTL
jgi:hypothetical protein